MTTVLDRFIKYVKTDTESAYNQEAVPSTEKQRDLALLLAEELKASGASEVSVSESGCVYARIPANCEGVPSIGFSSHIDTTPEFSGHDVKPRVVKNYDGGNIVLNKKENIVMSAEKFPHLKEYIGNDIVVTDGTTLLGADDKAGIAEIMTMIEYFHKHPEEKHGEIQLFFPTDEEIGCLGAKTLDKSLFDPEFAYTLDGGPLGEITYETFNAASADIVITGINIHPGLSKNQMKNAILIANEFINMLPPAETPGHTEKYEGYYHVLEFSGTVELTKMRLYLRDHDKTKFEVRKERVREIGAFLNKVYGDGTVDVAVTDTYRNISEALEGRFEIVEAVAEAMRMEGVAPFYTPMRGGTDGTILSFEGIPCPNICIGGHNFHSRYEYVPVQSMEKISAILVDIVKGFTK
ncbi:peptidase T [Cloacibacillus evryensis]|uniref:peptidase T n=1 Tax=Cloacibacillus evryensis TaxID=508460 RepID=UPI00241E9E13|nr:peptidase T [Cloacibacillus evryensis]